MIDLREPTLSFRAVRDALGFSPRPEGGHYRELWRDRPASGGRGAAILAMARRGASRLRRDRDRPPRPCGPRGATHFVATLLAVTGKGLHGFRSRWHRVDAAEIWLWQAGAALMLRICDTDSGEFEVRLGPDIAQGEALQAVVPAHAWQEAVSLGAWSLVACVVAPAFEFAGFEMAPGCWRPPGC